MGQKLIGVDLASQSATPLFALGTIHEDEFGRRFMYGKAQGAQTAGRWAIQALADDDPESAVAEAYEFTPMTTALVGTPGTNWKAGGVACCDVTDNYFAWFWIGYGIYTAIIENSFAAGEIIYSTANAGIPGTNSSSVAIDGVKTLAAGATGVRKAVFAAGRITYGLTSVHDI